MLVTCTFRFKDKRKKSCVTLTLGHYCGPSMSSSTQAFKTNQPQLCSFQHNTHKNLKHIIIYRHKPLCHNVQNKNNTTSIRMANRWVGVGCCCLLLLLEIVQQYRDYQTFQWERGFEQIYQPVFFKLAVESPI